MSTIAINPLIVQVKQNDLETISPINPTVHKGGIGKLIGVVAAVTIPVAAPAIASSIAASGALGASISAAMTTTIGGVISSAITGAALGAVSAAVSGQPIGAGALIGAVGGGIGGFTQGVSAGGAERVASGATTTAASGGAGLDTGVATVYDGAGNVIGTQSISEAGVVGGLQKPPGELVKLLSDTSETVISKLKSPENLANLTMQAAGSLVGEALVPEGTLAQLSPEEQALIEERKAELIALRDRDLAAYNQAIEISKQYMVQAGQVDPTYFAQQEANKAKIVGAQTARRIEEEAALADKNFTQGDKARLGLDTARVAASKFDEGFMTGTNLRTNLVDAAIAECDAKLIPLTELRSDITNNTNAVEEARMAFLNLRSIIMTDVFPAIDALFIIREFGEDD